MKFKKRMLLLALVPLSMVGAVSCVNNNNGFATNVTPLNAKVNDDNLTSEGLARIKEEPTDQSTVDSFIDTIISKGAEAITGGIQVYAKYVVLNLLKECGLDLRDATTKTLEKMQTQLNIIETKIDAIAAKQKQYHSEDVLNDVLKPFATANIRYMDYVTTGLAYLADLENNSTLSEDAIEQKRINAYNDGIKDLLFDGASFATYVTNLADLIIEPCPSAIQNDIFYYYDTSLGTCDKWTIQHYKNVKNFIAYIDSTLILLSNLAKFQIYYKAKDADDAMRNTYIKQIDNMAKAVNKVNKIFADKLESMQWIKDDWNKGLNKYIPFDKYYSTRVATLTHNLNETNPRQALLLGYYNDYGTVGCHQVAYAYQPNLDIVEAVANDYKSFAGDYCSSTYRIQDYLAGAGFGSWNDDVYLQAAGLYAGNFYVDKHGFLHEDFDYSIAYYDQKGEYTRKNAYEVVTYHTWYGGTDYTQLRANDTNYYICFGIQVNYATKLDGSYVQKYMWDREFTVEEAVRYKYYYMDFVNKPGPIGFSYMY